MVLLVQGVVKITCVDSTASDRLALQDFVSHSFESLRSHVGHLQALNTEPLSLQELLEGAPPACVIVGSATRFEEALYVCRSIRGRFANTVILLLREERDYTLRKLRRAGRVSDDVFSVSENPLRLVHRILALQTATRQQASGRILSISGVKGGVGTTTLAACYVHAAQALGKSAVVIDLSPQQTLMTYLGMPRKHSSDYSMALQKSLMLAPEQIRAMTMTAANGVSLISPPAGGGSIREAWLRDPKRCTVTLSLLEALREEYDMVLVDMAHAEGVLQFSIASRADCNLMVAANDAASLHLLLMECERARELSADTELRVICNELHPRGLALQDFQRYLLASNHQQAVLGRIPYDRNGSLWMGSGNTFYTEAGVAVRRHAERQIAELLGIAVSEAADERLSLMRLFNERVLRLPQSKQSLMDPLPALPAPETAN